MRLGYRGGNTVVFLIVWPMLQPCTENLRKIIMRFPSLFVYGFALFAMFFGSGNLVFPLEVGKETSLYWGVGFLGLFITGIFLPFLGLFVVKLHRGSYNAFFGEAGPLAQSILPLVTLSLLGSFGVVPRCITVAYGGIKTLWPSLTLPLFSAFFCTATFFFCLKEQRMMSLLGKVMSPLLLLTLGILIILGIWHAPPLRGSGSFPEFYPSLQNFSRGFMAGYKTMDLFAAFFFSSLTFSQIQKRLPSKTPLQEILKIAIKSSILAAFLLSLVYWGFIFLGAHYTEGLQSQNPEFILPAIAQKIMGKQAAIVMGMMVLFSCFTTALALTTLYARYLYKLTWGSFQKFPLMLLGTIGISFLFSLFDFRGIAAFLNPILKVYYPSVIALTILSIFMPKKNPLKKRVFYGILLGTLIIQIGF